MSDYQLLTKECAPTALSTAELPVSNTKLTAFRKIPLWIRPETATVMSLFGKGFQ